MKHLLLPDNTEHRLIFYLAMEEFAAKEMPDEAFFLWQVSPTVIFGRNQLMATEVNVDFCQREGIKMFRRKSGGGCVYSDWGNLMISYICRGENVTKVFDAYLQRLAALLRQIGVEAEVSGRNDIQIGGRKVSGNAFYKVPGKSIVHGTLLYSSNFERMQLAITPSEAKLKSKGVASVRQHVTNLCEHTSMPIEEFKQYLIDNFCDGERMLTPAEIASIHEIESTYLDESFFAGSNPAYTVTKTAKVPKVGEVSVSLEVRSGIVHHISLSGDYFILADPAPELNRRLRGKPLIQAEALLADFDASQHIANLSTHELIEIILKS